MIEIIEAEAPRNIVLARPGEWGTLFFTLKRRLQWSQDPQDAEPYHYPLAAEMAATNIARQHGAEVHVIEDYGRPSQQTLYVVKPR